jgi:hypothetical protein
LVLFKTILPKLESAMSPVTANEYESVKEEKGALRKFSKASCKAPSALLEFLVVSFNSRQLMKADNNPDKTMTKMLKAIINSKSVNPLLNKCNLIIDIIL